MNHSPKGILLLDKAKGVSSFSYIPKLRKLLNVQKIGHTGTLDPLARGLLVFLVGKEYTKQAEKWIAQEKEYEAILCLGKSTTTYDAEGTVTNTSSKVPTLSEVEKTLPLFQGEVEQVPPMFSAKKVGGKKLYELARKNQTVERVSCKVCLKITLMHYAYPHLLLHIRCSKGTYIRSLAQDLGKALGSYAHLHDLLRLKTGPFSLVNALVFEDLPKGLQRQALLEHLSYATPPLS
ncbi:MAG: tRNA pseudouridine(55) synthase TruB [Chlamydiota bacterium]